jgi:2-amino-4-hydroxy-6-hydroxymethyldihydropteridine diphosphokinase
MRSGIALGSNQGDRLGFIERAIEAIRLLATPKTAPFLVSPVYETAPVDCPPGSSPFLNAIVECDLVGPPSDTLAALQQIEVAFGRPAVRETNSPRPIDLDLLYMDDLVICEHNLVLPHPRIAQRRFVLEPLAAIRPDLILPGQSVPVSKLLAQCPDAMACIVQVTI